MTKEIKSCKQCLYTTAHPLGLTIDNEEICSGCRIHQEKNELDWKYRWELLRKIVQQYRCKDPNNFDCIIPVTGANDSYFIVHTVKNRLKLNPLLVTYNKYFNTPLGIRNLANLRIKFNCDILIQNVNPISVKKITRVSLRKLGSIYWPCLAGQTVFPVQTAVRYRIPLIIWGAHQGLEQVGMFSHTHEVEMTRRYRKDHDILGHEADDLISMFDTLNEEDIWQYRYPEDKQIKSVGVKGIYLGNYIRWDPKAQHEQMIRAYNYCTDKFTRTFDTYDHTDCFNYMHLHDLLKLYKYGYSKVTDHACREIRHKRITRDQGLMLVKRYEKKPAKNINLFCDWIGINSNSLKFLMDQHRNPRFWIERSPGEWAFNGGNSLHITDKKETKNPKANMFLLNSRTIYENGQKKSYVIIGKGFSDKNIKVLNHKK